MSEPEGHYETVGDVQEWVWDTAPERRKVPEGDFDPLDPEPPKKATPKAAPAKKEAKK